MFTSRDAKAVDLVDELVGRATAAMVNFLNIGAEQIHERAQVEVPKSGDHQPRPGRPNYPPESLEERSYVERASPVSLQSHVVYPGPYAAAQEAGKMAYESRGGKEVSWVAQHYTETGTKSHYLEDAAKSVLGALPEELAIQGHRAFGDLPGFITTPEAMQISGRKAEALPEATGEVAQIGSRESVMSQSVSPSSLTEVPGGHPPILQ